MRETDAVRRFYVRTYEERDSRRVAHGYEVADRTGFLPPRRFELGWGPSTSESAQRRAAVDLARGRNRCELIGGHTFEIGSETESCEVCDASVEPEVAP